MRVSGFTIIKNALLYDFPVVESISSVLPACDEFIVAVGASDDDTLGLIKNIRSDKLKIVETVWDERLRKDGKVMAVETNKALSACSGDWCFYIQADEVLHESELPKVKTAMEKNIGNPIGTVGRTPLKGAVIAEVLPTSPAKRVGLQANDIILEIGGMPTGSSELLKQALTASADKHSVVVRAARDNRAFFLVLP